MISEGEKTEWFKELADDVDYGRVIKRLLENRMEDEVMLPGYGKKLKVADFVIEKGDLKLIKEDGSTVHVSGGRIRSVGFDALSACPIPMRRAAVSCHRRPSWIPIELLSL
ncbi:hypothetical protein GCK32_021812 [Trichostrongylus colubriformis]|uniref:Uncharacterized protein n=1 Tax=Trichostrongylus colubriformis TaxID=6319 RepID=A0AAN8G3K6_TRICO